MRSGERNRGKSGAHSEVVAVAQYSSPTRITEGSGKSPGKTGFEYSAAPDRTTSRQRAVTRRYEFFMRLLKAVVEERENTASNLSATQGLKATPGRLFSFDSQ